MCYVKQIKTVIIIIIIIIIINKKKKLKPSFFAGLNNILP